jgi:trk system potassium uptake protein TrkH
MNLSPVKTVILFFSGLIVAGTLLLSLPFSIKSGAEFSVLSNLFTSASAVCVTGLSVVSIGEYYSRAGQIVLLILVQAGGLGYMFISTVAAVVLGKMTLKDRRIMQDVFGITSFKNLKPLLIKAVFFVLIIEIAGAVLLTFCFLEGNTFLQALYLGIFHSVTAFCNAGFSPFSDSLIGFSKSYFLLSIMSVLIILGSLGFFVLVDIYDTYKEKHTHFLLHTKVVIVTTAIIFVISNLFFLFYERTDFVISLFQSASFRTAGFTAIKMDSLSELGKLILMFLMTIGAAPASTGGGLKVTTVAVIFVFVKSFIKSENETVIFKRKLSDETVKKASLIFILVMSATILFSIALIAIEPRLDQVDLIFEMVSAFSNTGASVNITYKLGIAGQILSIIAMLVGRIGIITLLISAAETSNVNDGIKYPQANIFVG